MPNCELIEKCEFFGERMPEMPEETSVFKAHYCKGDNISCARFKVFKALGVTGVPSDLFPNQQRKARKIIETKSVEH